MAVDFGSIIERLLKMSPLNTLSEGDQMVVAGQLGGAMQEATRLAEREAELSREVGVHVYTHPKWDMKLMLEASGSTREQAEQNLSDEDDKSLLTFKYVTMTRRELEALPEWDG